MKVLVAEDNAIARMVLERHLRNWGYEVILAENGRLGWEAIVQEKPQMAILDWMMPEIDGVDLCRQIRAHDDSNIYLIMLTAKGRTDDVVAAFEAGADDYVVKPFDKDILKRRVAVGARIATFETSLTQSNHRFQERNEEIVHEISECASHIDTHIDRLKQCWSDLQSELTLKEPGICVDLLRDISKAIEGLSNEEDNMTQIIVGLKQLKCGNPSLQNI